MVGGKQRHPTALPPEGTPLLIWYEAGWARSRSECFGEEKCIAAAGIRTQGCLARSLDNSVHFISIGVTFCWTSQVLILKTALRTQIEQKHSTQIHGNQMCHKQETMTKRFKASTGTKAPISWTHCSVDWRVSEISTECVLKKQLVS
jgi:hypothetical protein